MRLKHLLFTFALTTIFLIAGKVGWGQYSGTGTFTKITSVDQLGDGYYVIANSGSAFAMNVTNAGSFFTHTAITPSGDEIVNPSNEIVWEIKVDGTDFSISNTTGANVTYVSYSGSSNAAYAVVDPASLTDNQRWTITYESDLFVVKNKAINTRILQYNAGSPRFACYTSAQQKFVIYKMPSAPDNTAPAWSANYPKIDGITKTSAVLKVSTDEPGKAFYQVLADGAAAPAVDDLIAAGTEIAIAAGANEYTEDLTGLTLGTAYDVYVVAQDDEATPNKQAAVTKIDLLTLAASNAAEIATFSFAEQTGSATIVSETGTIEIQVASGTPLNNLVATFSLSADATAAVGGVPQVSATTANDFSSDVTYTVTAEDGVTTKDWVVSVSLPSTEATITSTFYNVDGGTFAISNVPFNTPVDAFKSRLTPATAATFEVYESDETTLATTLATGHKVIVTAEAGNTQAYTIELLAAPTGDLFISEYIEGTGSNKAIEIYNGTGVALDLAPYTVKLAGNGGAWGSPQTLSGILANGEVYVIGNTSANAAILAQSDITSSVTFFNGNDALGLFNNDVLIDIFGQQGSDPGTGWSVAGITNATLDHTIIRKSAITLGNTDWATSFGTNETDSEWEVYPTNYIGGLGSHNQPKLSAEANITAFDVPGQVGDEVINTTAYTVTIGVTAATVKTALVPTIAVSAGATIDPASGVEQDFSAGKSYVVTAEGANTQSWNVTVTNYSNDATLSDLKVTGATVTGFASETTEYGVEVPFGSTEVPAVTYTVNQENATAVVTNAAGIPGSTTVEVTSQDLTTTKTYTINFTEGSPSTDASVTSTIYNVNAVEKSITGIPVTATLAEFKSNLTPATGATFEVYQADGTTVATNLATGYKVVVTAQDGIAKSTYTITLNTVLSSEANILTYSLLGVNATISSTGYTVTLTLPYGTSLDNLVATFTLSPAATAKVNDVVQVSGTTANSYSSALLYVITAEDGTIVNWTVTVTLEAPSSEASVTSTLYTVNSTDATITSVPFGTLLVDFKAAITPAANAVFEVYQPDGTTVATDLNSGYKLIVTAQDGTTKKVYTITIDEAPAVDLFFSEYIEGSSNNKAIEIYNPTGASVDLSIYSVKLSPNGDPWGTTETLTGTLASGEVFVITNAGAGAEIKAQSDLTSTVTYFNGNDAVGLFKNDVLIDVIGVPEYKPATVASWAVAGIDGATVDHTLVRRGNVVVGTTDWAASAGTNADNSQWIVNAKDDFTTLGTHSTALSSAAEITAFSFAEQVAAATIDATSGTITIEVVYGTDLTGLVSTFTVSAGAKAYVGDVLQVSGTTDNDFTDNVVYKVVAEDGTIKEWTVTVTMPAQPSTAAEIVSFVLAEQTGAATINSAAGTIAIEVNSTADLTALTPTIQVSAGASISPASGAVQDFTNAVTYTVTAQDNTTTKAWTVTVTKPQVNVVTIAQIQQTTGETGDSPYINQIVQTTGIVTAIYPNSGYFVQDGTGSWNGIYVYTKSATGLPSVGDEVKVTGTVTEYNSLTEIIGTTSLAITTEVLSQGNTLPAPVEVTTAAANAEQYESVLVKVSNAEVMGEPNSFNDYDVNDGSGVLVVDDRLFTLSLTVGARYSISGIIYFSNSAFRLLPRDASDIATGIDDVKWGVNLEVYPNPFTNTINFSNVEDVELITVTNLIGQRVMTVKPESSNSINTDNLIKGIYLVSFQNRDGKVIVKKMIKQ